MKIPLGILTVLQFKCQNPLTNTHGKTKRHSSTIYVKNMLKGSSRQTTLVVLSEYPGLSGSPLSGIYTDWCFNCTCPKGQIIRIGGGGHGLLYLWSTWKTNDWHVLSEEEKYDLSANKSQLNQFPGPPHTCLVVYHSNGSSCKQTIELQPITIICFHIFQYHYRKK